MNIMAMTKINCKIATTKVEFRILVSNRILVLLLCENDHTVLCNPNNIFLIEIWMRHKIPSIQLWNLELHIVGMTSCTRGRDYKHDK